tara:strand:- start:48 stop:641 length:594 start_codon:yes stop_codon:yes gene_type:complete
VSEARELWEDEHTRERWISRNGCRQNGYIHYKNFPLIRWHLPSSLGAEERRLSKSMTRNLKLYNQFENSGCLRYVCLALTYTMGMHYSAKQNILNLPFLFFFLIFSSSPHYLTNKLWGFFCVYLDIYILIHYFWHFSILNSFKQNNQEEIESLGLSAELSSSSTEDSTADASFIGGEDPLDSFSHRRQQKTVAGLTS